MNRGYIKLWRKSLDSQVWADPNLWRTWSACLMLANHKTMWVKIDGLAQPIRIEPGQFVTGRNEFHKTMFPKPRQPRRSSSTAWRWLQTLQNLGNLHIKTNNKFSIITIVNWHIYQGGTNENEQANEPQVNSRCTASEQQVNTNKNDKNDKNKNKESQPDFELTSLPVCRQAGEKLPPGFDKIPDLSVRDSLIQICKEISKAAPGSEAIFSRAYQFVNLSLNKNLRPDAILFALRQLCSIGPVKSPWPYAQHIAEVESKNLNEADAIAKHEALKKENPLAAFMDSRTMRM